MKTRNSLLRANFLYLISAGLLTFALILGCAPKLKMLVKMRDSYHKDRYEEVIGYEVECTEKKPECVEINALKADAYTNLQRYDEAEKYADKALAAIGTEYRNQDAALAYTIKGKLAIVEAKGLELSEQGDVLAEAEKALKKALGYNQDVSEEGREQQRANAKAANKFLCECYFMQWQISKGAEATEKSQKLKETAEVLKAVDPTPGIGDFYFIRATLNLLIPEITEAIFDEMEEEKMELKEKLLGLKGESESIHNKLSGDYQAANLVLQKDIDNFLEALK